MVAAGAAEPGLPTQTTFLCWWLAAAAAGDMETTTCHQASMEETVAGAVARVQQGLAALPEPAEIDPQHDCLRLYRIPAARGFEVLEHGRFKAVDFDGPLVL